MRFAKYYLLFLLSFSSLHADSSELAATLGEKVRKGISCPGRVVEAQEKGEYKVAISELQALITQKPTAELYLTLAVCYLRDQQEEEAFKTYIKCLEKAKAPSNKAPSSKTMSTREKAAYDELLALYVVNAPELESKLTATLSSHPDYHHVQFFLASASANARRYEPFFYLFYQSYCSYPDSHMSFKTQGVIASLILQRAKSPEEKEVWRRQALTSLGHALEICPQDTGLHKMLVYTASEKEKVQVLQLVFRKIVESDTKIARSEIPFYINHALSVKEFELAEQLLDKAKTWYEYSRIIQEMQDLIANKKAEQCHG